MPATVVVSDASVALKWFHEAGEEEVEPSRALVEAYLERRIELVVLDLTAYEIGNALLRGRAEARPAEIAVVLDALGDICPRITLDVDELRRAADLAAEHRLTFYDAAYAAAAGAREALLATLDRGLLEAGLGLRPSDVIRAVAGDRPLHLRRG